MMMMMTSELIQTLTDHFILQKEKLLARAGSRTQVNRERMNVTLRPHMEKVAELVQNWDIDPGLLIEAAFAWARRNKHPDGPLPTMLVSVKYLSKAISHHLELPFEVVAERRSTKVLLDKIEEDYAAHLPALERAGKDVYMMSSAPVEYCFAFAAGKFDRYAMKMMAPQLLELMARERKTAMWLQTKGLKYETIANAFNKN
jgi:hypothetical protein